MSVKQIEGYSIFTSSVLGRGSFGSVYLGRQQSTGQSVAVKILSKDSIDRDEYLKAALKNEIEILQKLHSDNIVALYEVMESSKNYYLIQELCDGDLQNQIRDSPVERSEGEAVEMLRQLCNGFLTLLREGIIHRDLKPANVMRQGGMLKLGDFGFARQMGSRSTVSTSVGTPLYMSLQVLKGEQYSSKCDVWALGLIFYELLHGETPWTAPNAAQLAKNIEKLPLAITRTDLTPETQDFLRRCLQLREANRISWDEIFAHAIFDGYFLSRSDSRVFENRMKMIMNKLRFYISQQNLDLRKVMDSMGFGSGREEIVYHDFYQFFRRVYPQITHEDADYVFRRTDADHSGTISVEELKDILLESGMKLASQFELVPSFERRGDGRETFTRISAETSGKIKNCFQKLYRIINKNGLTLWRVFAEFDAKQGSLTRQQFALLIRKVCANYLEISEEEIAAGFDLIDEDGSDSIEFEELDKYYSKINGVAQAGGRRQLRRAVTEGTLQFRPREGLRRRTRAQDQQTSQRFVQLYVKPPPYQQLQMKSVNNIAFQASSPKETPFNPFAILRKRD